MDDVFKPNSLSIKKLFGDADALYQIPRYQRAYSWGDDQLEKLWDDLTDAQENLEHYFLGSVITAKPQDETSYMDIVDGQQRLTTLTIMLCVLRDLYPKINEELQKSDPKAIGSSIIQGSIKYNENFERLRLRTHANHQSDFESIILNGDTKVLERPYKYQVKQGEEPKFKFINTAAFFRKKFQEIGEQQSGILLNYLFSNVRIIRIDCQSVTFAIKLFQVLNDRGLDLTNADLVKSYLIGRIQEQYGSTDEVRKQKEDQFIADWMKCEEISKHTETSLNDLFVFYEYYLLGQNPKKSLFDELKAKFDGKDPNDVISEFRRILELYKTEIFDKRDKLIYSLSYVRWVMYWRTLLLTALISEYADYERFAVALRRYYYLNWIAGFTLSRIKQTSFNMINWLKNGRAIDEIEAELEKHMEKNEVLKRVQGNLNGEIYYDAWCKPLLCSIEYMMTDESKVERIEINDRDLHVEHILPEKYEAHEEWSDLHGNRFANKHLNGAGNLTLLSGRKNIEASNRGYEVKKSVYHGNGLYGQKDTGITAFKITQAILDNHSDWSVQDMNNRKGWLFNMVSSLLDIQLIAIEYGVPIPSKVSETRSK